MFFIMSHNALALGGGKYAKRNEFYSVIKFFYGTENMIKGFCSATKVSSHWFITSAHCGFVDKKSGELSEMLNSDSHIFIENSVQEKFYAIIDKSIPHESYKKLTQKMILNNNLDDGNGLAAGSYDIAMFKIREETPFLEISKIHFNQIEAGTEVVLAGFGEEIIYEWSATSEHRNEPYRLKFGNSKVLESKDEYLQKSRVSKLNPLNIKKFNFLTAGKIYNNKFVSMRHGDSGGPIFKLINNQYYLVSVNSFVVGSQNEVSFANVHPSLWQIRNWVKTNLKQ